MAKRINKKTIDGKLNEEQIVKEEKKIIIKQNLSGGKANVKSIDELLGRRTHPYSQGSVEEYENKLRNMGTTDLERHATEMGSLPNANRRTLVTRLVEKYRKNSSPYFNTNVVNNVEPKNPAKLLEVLKHAK